MMPLMMNLKKILELNHLEKNYLMKNDRQNVPWVGDGGVLGVSLSIVSLVDDKNSKVAGNDGIWSDIGSSDGLDSVSDVELCPQSLWRNLCHGCKVGEKVRVFLLHLVFTFRGELRTPPRVTVYFDNQNMTLLQMLDLTVHDLDWFFDEVQFVVNLDLI
ncbi:hypothetical protein Tco_1439417 [Tanacetum coccineum]